MPFFSEREAKENDDLISSNQEIIEHLRVEVEKILKEVPAGEERDKRVQQMHDVIDKIQADIHELEHPELDDDDEDVNYVP